MLLGKVLEIAGLFIYTKRFYINILFTSFSKKGFVEICCLVFMFIKSLNTSFDEIFVVELSASSTNEKS